MFHFCLLCNLAFFKTYLDKPKTIVLDKQKFERKIVNIFLPISFSTCFLGAQKNRLIEYPQHMFWLRNKEIIFLAHTLN